MSGFLGDVSAAAAANDHSVATARAWDAALAERPGAQSGRGRRWFAGVTKRGAAAEAWLGDDGFALVQGAPRVAAGSPFAAEARERGIAAACAAEYARAGRGFLSLLQGPFALAIHLERQGNTLLAVDKLGVFSLYLSAAPGRLTFASELVLLSRAAGMDVEIDPQAIYDYLYFHVIPGPRTVFKQVRRLPAAGFFERTAARDESGLHWQPRFQRERDGVAFDAEKREFVQLLETSVRAELDAAGRAGCFLSGGTDSSTLAGMVSKVGGEPARTYSIGFDQRGFDEIEYARIAARHFGTAHKEYYVEARDIVRIVPTLAGIYGQPFGNSSVVPTFCCAEMAAADGVTTMIAGDGGDELFGGNQRYATQVLFSYYLGVPAALRKHVLEPLAFKTPGAGSVLPLRKFGRYIEQALVPMPDRLQTYNHLKLLGPATVFEADFLAQVDPGEPDRVAAAEYGRSNAVTLLNKMLAFDWKYTLADNDLPKVAGMCDAAGVGVAFPFLRHELVEFASRLPAAQKVNRLRLRYFFKKALADFLPPEIIRKKKHGFGMPFGDWLIAPGQLRDLAFDSLSRLRGRGIVRPAFIDDLCGPRLAQHPNYYGGLIWLLLVLELWLEWQHGVRAKNDAAST